MVDRSQSRLTFRFCGSVKLPDEWKLITEPRAIRCISAVNARTERVGSGGFRVEDYNGSWNGRERIPRSSSCERRCGFILKGRFYKWRVLLLAAETQAREGGVGRGSKEQLPRFEASLFLGSVVFADSIRLIRRINTLLFLSTMRQLRKIV